MAEAKQKRQQFERMLHETTEQLADEGWLIMAGFAAYRQTVMPKEVSDTQLHECFVAYLAGCQHLWASMIDFLEPGQEVTAKDEKRMEMIFAEMQKITGHLYRVAYPTKGNA